MDSFLLHVPAYLEVWKNIWFWIISGTFVTTTVFGYIRFRTIKGKRKEAFLEAQVYNRTREIEEQREQRRRPDAVPGGQSQDDRAEDRQPGDPRVRTDDVDRHGAQQISPRKRRRI